MGWPDVHGRPRACQATSSLLHEEKIAPVHSDFRCETSSLSLMGSAGRRPIAYTHSKCLVRRGLCQPRSDLSCHQLAGCLSNRRWGSSVRVDVVDVTEAGQFRATRLAPPQGQFEAIVNIRVLAASGPSSRSTCNYRFGPTNWSFVGQLRHRNETLVRRRFRTSCRRPASDP